MNKRPRGWINTSNIYGFLLAKFLLAFVMLLVCQVLFYLSNTRIFHDISFTEWMGILWGNVVFGCATVAAVLLPYFVLNLLPFNFRWSRPFRVLTEVLLYFVPMALVLLADICDASYYLFTYRRLSGEIFSYLTVSGDMGSLLPQFAVDYPISSIGIVVVLALFAVCSTKIKLLPRDKYRKHLINDIVGLAVSLPLLFLCVRGCLNHPLELGDGAYFCQAKNQALVTNSGYNILRTLDKCGIPDYDFMSDDQALTIFNAEQRLGGLPEYNPDLMGWQSGMGPWTETNDSVMGAQDRYPNVVVIMLESFSQEYMGCYNPDAKQSFTPFLDELSKRCILYQGRANGKKSIESVPAVFASIPTLHFFPLPNTDFYSNDMVGLPAVLHRHGYHTAFFHGSYNGVMGFDSMCYKLGFVDYEGQNEYMNDLKARHEDEDGFWGIFDEPYLQHVVRKISTYREPFMAGIFTISSHHPYTMPESHKDEFSEGEHPIMRVVSYTDYALRKFFESASKQPWFDNTLFIITADHSGPNVSPKYNDYGGWYRIPMMVYLPHQERYRAAEGDSYRVPHKVYQRIMQQTDIMPTLLDYLNIDDPIVSFGKSVFGDGQGWHIVYGNGYYQLETQDGVAVISGRNEEVLGNGNMELLKSVLQQYSARMRENKLVVH